MSFFEPLPPPPEPTPPVWAPPLWDRPSEGTLPAIVPVEEVVHRSERAIGQLQRLEVYPNGFTINLMILTNPRGATTERGFAMFGGPGPDHARRFPRIGVRFSDGRTAGHDALVADYTVSASTDDAGIPTEPVVKFMGGGGGMHGFSFSAWVYPLPPDGPVEVYVALPAFSEDETKVVVDGAEIRAAATRAVVIWE